MSEIASKGDNTNMKRNWLYRSSLIVILLVVSACSHSSVTLEHIHGLGYTSDGKQLLIPSHDGLISYSEGKWKELDTPKHDYMGFQVVDTGFYSSGHPSAGSALENPLGIVKSSDLGKTLIPLGLQGESDMHAMGVGYISHVIYVVNDHKNSKLNSTGLFYSTDDAHTWTKSAAAGLNEEATALAVHPTNAKTIVIGTKNGVFLSNDAGNRFERIVSDLFVTALIFSEGDLYITGSKNPTLIKFNLTTKEKKETKLPTIDKEDAVSYIALNPMDEHEIAIASFKKDVYISKDSGATWTKITE